VGNSARKAAVAAAAWEVVAAAATAALAVSLPDLRVVEQGISSSSSSSLLSFFPVFPIVSTCSHWEKKKVLSMLSFLISSQSC
jgi:hypothetical protein